jgi:hypothetical protein
MDPTKARGYRNRNPGNIEHHERNRWNGLAEPPSDGRFARFVSHEHGIRALALLLLTYQDRHDLRTIAGIIGRWAPTSENNTRAYIGRVAEHMRVGAEDELDLHNPDTMRLLVEGIIIVELGGQPYDDATLSEGLRMAGLPQGGAARSGTLRVAAAGGAAAFGSAATIEAVAQVAAQSEGIATVARALGPWVVAIVVLAVVGLLAWDRWQRLRRVTAPEAV